MKQTYLNTFFLDGRLSEETPNMPAIQKRGEKMAKVGKKKLAKNKFIDGEAEVSGDDESSGNSEEESGEETLRDRAFIDDSAKGAKDRRKRKKKRKTHISKEEMELDEDDFLLVKEACLGVNEEYGDQQQEGDVYADLDEDEENIYSSDREFIDDRGAEKRVERTIRKYVAKQGVSLAPSAVKSKQAESQALAVKNAYNNTRAFLKAHYGHCITKPKQNAQKSKCMEGSEQNTAKPTCHIKPLQKNRKVAAVFNPNAWAKAHQKPVKSSVPAKLYSPGMVVNPITKEISFRRRDGTLEPRPGAL